MNAIPEIYNGIRGERFVYFLQQVLSLSNLNKQYYDILLDKESLIMYDQVFTHKTANPDNNYEYLEFLGDTTLNKSIAWYLSRRFPQLKCPQGVKVLTRLKINLISKRSFASFAKQLHFWDFVSADMDVRSMKMDKTLEDVFEAFFGATELIIDSRIQMGAGYLICYNIVKHLLDSRDISLKYEHLFDAKTRLKEIFDHFSDKLGELKYDTKKVDRIHHVTAKLVKSSSFEKDHFLGYGSAPLKADAQQRAATEAIATLELMGFVKPLSDSYALFCT